MAHPEKANSGASGTEQSPIGDGLEAHIQRLWTRIRLYVISNPVIVIWNVSLLLGGLIFLGYFFSIGFMPQLGLEASITLLAAAAITGAFWLIVLSMLLVLPGLYWRFFAFEDERLKPLWYQKKMLPYHYLKKGCALEAMDYPNSTYLGWPRPPILPDKFFSPLRAWLWFSLPIGGAIAVMLIMAYIRGPVISESETIWVAVITLFVPTIVALITAVVKLNKWRTAGILVVYISISIFLFLWPLVLLILFSGVSQASGEVTGIIILIGSIIGVILFNTGIATYEIPSISDYLYYTASAILIIIFFLFSIFKIWSFIPNLVVETYKFGNIENASLVVDEVGCTIAEQYGLTIAPESADMATPDSVDRRTCLLQGVDIHSRLGSAYYVEAPNDTVTFTIPRQHVLSWSPSEEKE